MPVDAPPPAPPPSVDAVSTPPGPSVRIDRTCRWLSHAITFLLAPLSLPVLGLGLALTASLMFAIIGLPLVLGVLVVVLGTNRLTEAATTSHRPIAVAAGLHTVAVGGAWWLTARVAFERVDGGTSADTIDDALRVLRPIWPWSVRGALVVLVVLIAAVAWHSAGSRVLRLAIVGLAVFAGAVGLLRSDDALWQPTISCTATVLDTRTVVELDSRWDLLLDQSHQAGSATQLRRPFEELLANADGRTDVEVTVVVLDRSGNELATRTIPSVARRVVSDSGLVDVPPEPGQTFTVAAVTPDEFARVGGCDVRQASVTVPVAGGNERVAHLLS